jgi:DNA-binding PucR family transcriptional regulator
VFLQTGENYVRTAELLNVHRNTVKYRLGKIAPEAGDTVDDRTDIGLALEICNLLGSSVLAPATPGSAQ